MARDADGKARVSREEQETLLRWDNDTRTLQACTADPTVAARWRKAGLPVRVYGRVNGQPRSWVFDLPWAGKRKAWVDAFRASLRAFRVAGDLGASAP